MLGHRELPLPLPSLGTPLYSWVERESTVSVKCFPQDINTTGNDPARSPPKIPRFGGQLAYNFAFIGWHNPQIIRNAHSTRSIDKDCGSLSAQNVLATRS